MDHAGIFEVIRRHISEVAPELQGRTITEADSLRALGLDSVSRVEVLVLTMEELGVKVPHTRFKAARNIGDVLELLKGER